MLFNSLQPKVSRCTTRKGYQAADVLQVLQEFDFDGNGLVSLEEFEQAISKFGCSLAPNELQVMFEHGPLYKNELSYREWNWIILGKRQILKQWKKAGQRNCKSARRFFQEVCPTKSSTTLD